MLTKPGECYYRDEAGQLWLAESWMDEDGAVTSTATAVGDGG